MQIISVAYIFRYIEIAIDFLGICVYYGTHTTFKFDSRPTSFQFDFTSFQFDSTSNAGSNFGQFVLIGGLIGAVIVLLLSIFLEADKKYYLPIVIYNAVFLVFFLAAGILILTTWTKYDRYIGVETQRKGGLTVGSFCIIQCFVLAAGAAFTYGKSK